MVFSKDDLSIIVSQFGKLIMLDFYTSSMCIESWGRSSFARCLIEINAGDVLKESLIVSITPFVDTPIVEKTNDGFQMVGKKKKKGKSKATNDVSSLMKNQPLKAIVPPTKEGGSSSTFTVAAG
ncbi:hypothetical protein Tco_0946187 [Tanacetum coccineum]